MKYGLIYIGDFMYAIDKKLDLLRNGSTYSIKDNKMFDGFDSIANIVATTDPSLNLPLIQYTEIEPIILAREAAVMNNYDIEDDVFIHGFVVGYRSASAKQFTEKDMKKAWYDGRESSHEHHDESQRERFMNLFKIKPVAVDLETVSIQTTKKEEYQYKGDHQINLDYASILMIDENNFVKIIKYYYE